MNKPELTHLIDSMLDHKFRLVLDETRVDVMSKSVKSMHEAGYTAKLDTFTTLLEKLDSN